MEIGYQRTREELHYAYLQDKGLEENAEIKFNLPLSGRLDWRISYVHQQSRVQGVHDYDAPDFSDYQLEFAIKGTARIFESSLVYQFRPDYIVNPFASIGIGYQERRIREDYKLEHFALGPSSSAASDMRMTYESKQRTETFSVTSGIEFTISNTLSIQTYLSTGDSFNKPDIEKIMTDYVTFHVDSTWNIGKKFYLGAGISSDFQDSDVALAIVTGRTF